MSSFKEQNRENKIIFFHWPNHFFQHFNINRQILFSHPTSRATWGRTQSCKKRSWRYWSPSMKGMTSTQTLTSLHISTSLVKWVHWKPSSWVSMASVDIQSSILISLLEIKWTDEYPSELPALSLGSFYNKHLVPEVKTNILKAVTGENSFVTCIEIEIDKV